jgi:uncharacterized protein YutE (UPF0331/DUF86 family)
LEKLRMAAGRYQEQEQALRSRVEELHRETTVSAEEQAEMERLQVCRNAFVSSYNRNHYYGG